MGLDLKDIEDEQLLRLSIKIGEKNADIQATKQQSIRSNTIAVSLDIPKEKVFNFTNVHVDAFYNTEDSAPIKWAGVKIQYVKGLYVIMAAKDGIPVNRRETFRIGVACIGTLQANGHGDKITVKDVSMTGFAVTDRGNKLQLAVGDMAVLTFTDIGFEMAMKGQMVRTETVDETTTVYGFQLKNMPKDLSTYISMKQRKKS